MSLNMHIVKGLILSKDEKIIKIKPLQKYLLYSTTSSQNQYIIFTSSSGTPKFLSTFLALFNLSFLRSASVPITVFGLLLGETVLG